MRFFLTIEYDGSEYIGWQRQNSGLSVQEIVENSIYKIIQINLNIYGSGRTDAGVHATGQVAHVDIITKEFEENRLMDAINAYLLDHKIKVTDYSPGVRPGLTKKTRDKKIDFNTHSAWWWS